jgi:hypothetical protein
MRAEAARRALKMNKLVSVALLFASAWLVAPRAEAQLVSVELAGRLGVGYAMYDTASADAVPGIGGGDSGLLHVGALLGARHVPTGLGANLGYAHAFQGLGDTYGTHAVEARFSELVPVIHSAGFRAGLLIELGGLFAVGGGQDGCGPFAPSNCMTDGRQVPVSLIGGVAALGAQFNFSAFFFALEANYRLLGGLQEALRGEHDLLFALRAGVAIDLL